MKSYIMALDQGTTSSKAIIFDKSGKPLFPTNELMGIKDEDHNRKSV